ncbi:MAG: hypothetical protein AAF773_26935 [Cyanobacteria bacterium P01_D01_bin.115]
MTTTTSSSNNPEDNRQDFVGKVRLKAVRDGTKVQVMDATEAFIRGAVSIQTIVRHPIKALFMFGGGAISLLMLVSLVWGSFYIAFGKPGSVTFAWNNPTTWIPAASDPIRRPIGRAISGVGSYLSSGGQEGGEQPSGEASGYDPDAYQD